MKIMKLIFFYLLGLFAILCISVFPQYMYLKTNTTDAPGYLYQLFNFIQEFMDPSSWNYVLQSVTGLTTETPILHVLWDPFVYSMQILLGAIFLGTLIAFILAAISIFMAKKHLPLIKSFLNILESIPDLVIATLLQMLVIYVYKSTGITIFNVATYMDNRAYFGPILTLSILPMISIYKILLISFEEELSKNYVLFLKNKGLSNRRILVRHVFKNIMPALFHHMKIVIWIVLSSQFIIERIFNVHGLTYYLIESFNPMTIAFTLLFLFTPFYFIFQIIDIWLFKDETYSKPLVYRQKLTKISFIKKLNIAFQNLLFDLKNIKFKGNPIAFRRILISLLTYLKNWKVALGVSFFIVTISYSVIYGIITDNHVEKITLYFEEDGKTLIGVPPYAPPDPFLMGSDYVGVSIWDQLVVGAKYTLIFGLIIAFLRVFLGLLFGAIYTFVIPYRMQKWLEKFSDSLHFLPLSIVAYILLEPVLLGTNAGVYAFSLTERILIEIFILTILVVPLTTILLGNEMKQIMKEEFITSAKTLGGGKLHIFWKHILPHIGPRFTILFGQQFIQVLILFIHLGVFNFFFGGTKGLEPPVSQTYEWSGLIGYIARGAIRSGKYWYLLVLLAFMLAIFAMQLIIQGINDIQQERAGIYKHKRRLKRNQKDSSIPKYKPEPLTNEKFTWLNRNY
jgi:peptide/nickel transport system permease protein